MKKLYTKPEIMFESFSLSACIAACQNESSHDGVGCKAYYDEEFGVVLFSNSISDCIYTPSQLGNDGLCYDVPTISLNIFGS